MSARTKARLVVLVAVVVAGVYLWAVWPEFRERIRQLVAELVDLPGSVWRWLASWWTPAEGVGLPGTGPRGRAERYCAFRGGVAVWLPVHGWACCRDGSRYPADATHDCTGGSGEDPADTGTVGWNEGGGIYA